MPVSDKNLPLYAALQEKRLQLSKYSKALFDLRTPATAPVIDPQREEITLEMILINGVMSDLNHNNDMDFPSGADFQNMRNAVAALRNAIEASAGLSSLMAAGSAVLAAWPA